MRLVLNSQRPLTEHNRISTVANVEGNTIYIYDYIETYSPWNEEDRPATDQVSSEKFLATIRNMTGDITVRINSKGGEVGYALSIYQCLSEHPSKVTTIVDGYAYSCASWILLAGETREIMPGGVVMTHNPSMYCYLSSEMEFQSSLQQWKVNRDSVATLTSNRTGLKIEDVYDMMDKQTFMNANDAIAKGFCTGIREGKASIPKGVSNFLPSAIRNAVPEVSNSVVDLADTTRLLLSKNVGKTRLTR